MLIDTILMTGNFPGTCMPSSTTGRCWSTWWVRMTSVASSLWAAGTTNHENIWEILQPSLYQVRHDGLRDGLPSPLQILPQLQQEDHGLQWDRGPGETAEVLADRDLQPQEGGEEVQWATGPGAIPLSFLHLDDGRGAGGWPVQPGARLLQISPWVH